MSVSPTDYIVLSIFLIVLNSAIAQHNNEKTPKINLPGVRNAHSMTFSSTNSKIYLFGGADQKAVLAELWEYQKGTWLPLLFEDGPPARTFASLVYDPQNERLLLFGGSKVLFGKGPDSNNLMSDTWEFKDKEWNKLTVSASPSPRAEASMVYDTSRNRIVLFGGYKIEGNNYLKLRDTWEFYENEWILMSETGPSARHGAAMVYDRNLGKVVLFGGSTSDRQYGEGKGETWFWDGTHWTKADTKQPYGIFNAAMAYDIKKAVIVRFGGWNGKGRDNSTWIYRNNQWQEQKLQVAPSPRNHSSIVYDEEQDRILLYGGHDGKSVFGDLWEFKDGQWNELSGSEPLKRIKNGH